jgi:hypothetical protein
MTIYKADGTILLTIDVDDKSYCYKEVQGDNYLTLYFNLVTYIEIPVGSYCEFGGEVYTLERPHDFKINNSENHEYTVIMYSPAAKLGKYKMREVVYASSTGVFGGTFRLKFSLTAQPQEHLQMIVDNLNLRDGKGVWSIGECIKGTEKTISYNHIYCLAGLTTLAEQYDTEYEVIGRVISLHKVEYNKSNPLPLSYGQGNGFTSEIERKNYDNSIATDVLFSEGGDQNIDKSKYGSQELLLPKGQKIKYDGNKFEDEQGFISANAREYYTDDSGFSVRRTGNSSSLNNEDSIDCTEIYPKRVGTVSQAVVVNADKNLYDIVDSSIPDSLDYSKYLIAGENMTIIFQSGMLAGKEFDVQYHHAAVSSKAAKRFEIVSQEIDGETMPNSIYAPAIGDKYAVFHCALPDAYICDNATKTGASWDMFRKCVKFLYEHENQQFSFTGNLDGIWAKNDWKNIGGKIKLGGYVSFSDPQAQITPVLARIISIKQYINNPESPDIQISNTVTGGGIQSQLKEIPADEVKTEDYHTKAIQFTKRRFRDAQETIAALDDALLTNFTNSINPVAVQTMALLVGDQSLQFIFVDASEKKEDHVFTYNNSTKILSTAAGILKHMTLGINTISNAHAASEYKHWSMSSFDSSALTDGTKKYYLYAKCSKSTDDGVFYLSETAMAFDGSTDYYLLVGILNSEYEGERSFASMYGFSEVLPSRMTTDKITSSDGKTYIDLANGIIAGALKFYDSNATLKDVLALQKQVDSDGKNTAENSAKLKGFTSIDGGLITTNHIKLGNTTDGSETAGISGLTGNPNNIDPAFWAGGNGNGTYAKALQMLANIVFTHQGNGKIGKMHIDPNGDITVEDTDGTLGMKIKAGNITALADLKSASQNGSASGISENGFVDESAKTFSETYTLATVTVANDGSKLSVGSFNCYLELTNTYDSETYGMVEYILYKGTGIYHNFGTILITNDGLESERQITKEITVGNEFASVDAGTYTIKAIVNLSTKKNRLEMNLSGGAIAWLYNPVQIRTEIGRNGILMYYDANNYFYCAYSNAANDKRLVRETRGVFREDGIISSGRVNEAGSSVLNSFGPVTCTVSNSGNNGNYTITHNLGHTNYVVLITPVQNSNSRYDGNAVIVSKGTTSFSVQTSYSDSQTKINFPFEFLIIGKLTN